MLESAYDARIPRMVASYFAEMKAIFAAVRNHLTERATVVLDIGDSAYGNVHVPTDRILTGILSSLGFSLRRELVLRKRLSRGGLALRQVLLVLDAPRRGLRPLRDQAAMPVASDSLVLACLLHILMAIGPMP